MIFGQIAQRSLESPSTPLTGQNLHEYLHEARGADVNPETAMGLPAVYTCINVLSGSLAQLPLVVLRRQGERIEPGTDHPAHYLLHDEPNNWQTSYKWRETAQAHVLGWGNGYSHLIRGRRGELASIERRMPWETTLVQIGSRWVYSSRDDDGRPLAIAPEDMLHIRALGSDGRTGKSPIRQHAEAIGLGLAAQRYGKDFFDGGGRPTGLVTVKNGTLNDNSWERLKTVWKAAVASLRQSENKTLLLPADLDYKALTIAPEDAQFLETRKMSRSELAGVFNMPAHMINDLDKATFSNISEQAIQFVRHTMMPWVVNWEQEINRRVFTRAERLAGYYVKFNLAGLLRGTPKERAEFYHYAITDGWMDRNEVRALEDLNPRDGLDEMLISVNAKPASQIGQEPPTPTA
ncbi:Phage portal protein [compost metagenome]